MRNGIVLVLSLIALVGCGNKQEKSAQQENTSFEGTAQKLDYVSQGIVFLKQGEVSKAIQSLDQAIKEDPTNAEKYIVLGQVYTQLHRPDRAVDTLSAAAKVAPTNGEVFYLLGLNMALDGRMQESMAVTQKSLQIFQNERNQEKFTRSLALLKDIQDGKVKQIERQ